MRRLLLLSFLAGLSSSCLDRKVDQINDLKKIVIQAFRLASEKKYDSLSQIMPKHYFENTTREDLSMAFSEITRSIDLGDGPNESNLNGHKDLVHGYPGYVVTYFPKTDLYSGDSLKIFKIDSIQFYFMEPLGLDRISSFEVFGPIPLIKPVLPATDTQNRPRND